MSESRAIEFSNCSTSDLTYTGIYIYYSADIVVSSSRIQGPLHTGVSTDACDNVTVLNTTVTDCVYGGHFRGGGNLTISGCEFVDCTNDGIWIDDMDDTTVVYSTFGACSVGVHGRFVNRFNITGNTARDCKYAGIATMMSTGVTLMDNNLDNASLYPYGYFPSHLFFNEGGNVVNGKPLGHFSNLTSGTIDASQYGQVVLVNCTDVVVEQGSFERVYAGVQLAMSSNCTVRNIAVSDARVYGIYVLGSSNTTVESVQVDGPSAGIRVSGSPDTTVDDVYVANTFNEGILFSSSSSGIVNNSVIVNSKIGVRFASSHYGTINRTHIENASLYGIDFFYS
ncbi:MAG: right-handed parallel beta-helix repeat-containing protein [Candidatus Thorarchaeota archaeon]